MRSPSPQFKAANSNCVGERVVVLKQKGNGVLSRVESKANGNWKADLEDLNENIEIHRDRKNPS